MNHYLCNQITRADAHQAGKISGLRTVAEDHGRIARTMSMGYEANSRIP